MSLEVVKREVWGAEAPLWIKYLKLPVSYVFYEYTNKDNCHTRDGCSIEVNFLQKFNLKLKNNPDIRYNFLIGGDGSIYEGRGWHAAPRLPQKYQHMDIFAVYIAFIGTFKYQPPSEMMYHARDQLIRHGVELGYIKPKCVEYNITVT